VPSRSTIEAREDLEKVIWNLLRYVESSHLQLLLCTAHLDEPAISERVSASRVSFQQSSLGRDSYWWAFGVAVLHEVSKWSVRCPRTLLGISLFASINPSRPRDRQAARMRPAPRFLLPIPLTGPTVKQPANPLLPLRFFARLLPPLDCVKGCQQGVRVPTRPAPRRNKLRSSLVCCFVLSCCPFAGFYKLRSVC